MTTIEVVEVERTTPEVVAHPPRALLRLRRRRWLRMLPWVVVFGFGVVEATLIVLQGFGPFFDEGIYVTAGLRTVQGFGSSDYYMTWFAGSLLAPILHGLGWLGGGLVGARLVSALAVTLAIGSSVRATQNLFGTHAALWTAITFATSGPALALGQLAVYDTIALLGVSLSFAFITETARRNNRVWLILAAVAFGIAIISKYPIALCGLPLVALLLLLRGQRALLDIFMFCFVTGVAVLIYYLPARDQVSQFFPWRVQNNPDFGASATMVNYGLAYFSWVPVALAFIGFLVAQRQRYIAVVLLGSMLLWPAYHAFAVNSVSATKHIVFGFLFGYPLIGLVFASLVRMGWLAKLIAAGSILVLAGYGWMQMTTLNSGWVDVRPPATYMTAHVTSRDYILSNNSWPFVMYMYGNNNLSSPWQVYDPYRIDHHQAPIGLCGFDWFVNEESSYSWSSEVIGQIRDCGTFESVYTTTATVTNLGQSLTFVNYPVQTTIWHNTNAAQWRHDNRKEVHNGKS